MVGEEKEAVLKRYSQKNKTTNKLAIRFTSMTVEIITAICPVQRGNVVMLIFLLPRNMTSVN